MDSAGIVQTLYGAFGQGDLATFVSYLLPETVWQSRYSADVPLAGEFKGPEGVLAFFTAVDTHLSVQAFAIEQIVAQGTTVVVFGAEEVTVKANQQAYRNTWIHRWQLTEAGKVSRVTSFNDTATVQAAFARKPAP